MGEIGYNRKKMKCADQTCGSSESREDPYMASGRRWHLGWGMKEG